MCRWMPWLGEPVRIEDVLFKPQHGIIDQSLHRVIVSEPFSDLPAVWHEIPPATAVTVRRGGVLEQQRFRPTPDAVSAAVPDATAAVHA